MNSPHRSLWKLVALSLLVTSTSALADRPNDGFLRRKDFDKEEQASEDRGFAIGLRAGYGAPLGKLGAMNNRESPKLNEVIKGVIPAQVDVGYFFNSNLYLGGSFQYGLGLFAEDCAEGASCRLSQMRFGVTLNYHFKASEKLEPYLGLGVGYEIINASVSSDSEGGSLRIGTSYSGFEFATLQGGLDYRVTKMLSVGPFVTFTGGVYSTIGSSFKVESDNPILGNIDESESESIDEKEVHAWLYGGVRLQLRF